MDNKSNKAIEFSKGLKNKLDGYEMHVDKPRMFGSEDKKLGEEARKKGEQTRKIPEDTKESGEETWKIREGTLRQRFMKVLSDSGVPSFTRQPYTHNDGSNIEHRSGGGSANLESEPMRFQQLPQSQPPRQGQAVQADTADSIQRKPPTGWHLEESHLSEPLFIARRRTPADSSQKQMAYEHNEVASGSLPLPPSSADVRPVPAPSSQSSRKGTSNAPTSSLPRRKRTSNVPPSSARRYAYLFDPPNQQSQERENLSQTALIYPNTNPRKSLTSPPQQYEASEGEQRANTAVFGSQFPSDRHYLREANDQEAAPNKGDLQFDLPPRQPNCILSLEEQNLAIQAAPDSTEIGKIWTLNRVSRWTDSTLQEKFHFYYHEPRNQWTQVTVNLDYGVIHANTFEGRLLREPLEAKRSAWLYAMLRSSLLETKLFSTVTNFEIKSQPGGQLSIWMKEDTEWSIKDYPSANMRMLEPSVPKFEESHTKLQSQISSYIYRVNVQSTELIRHDIAGPSASGAEAIITGLCRLQSSAPQVSRLAGIVVDDTHTYVKGILYEPLGLELRRLRERPVTWKQCLRWALQITLAFRDALGGGLLLDKFSILDVFADELIDVKVRITLSNAVATDYEKGQHGMARDGLPEFRANLMVSLRRLGLVLESLVTEGSPPDGSSQVPMWFDNVIQRCRYGDLDRIMPAMDMLETIVSTLKMHLALPTEKSHDAEVASCDSFPASEDDEDEDFDAESVISIETAITSASGYGNLAHTATMVFVDLLYEAVDIHELSRPRVEARTLDVDGFRHGVRRLIKIMSKDLSKELPQATQRDMSSFFMSASRPISTAIIDRAGLKLETNSDLQQIEYLPGPNESEIFSEQSHERPAQSVKVIANILDVESEASEASEVDVEEQEATVNLSTLRGAVAASAAFKTFVTNLQELICPTFESKLRRMSQVAKEKEVNLDPDGKLRELLSELLYARPLEILLSETDDCSWVDRVKDYVEASTDQPWDWWPLSPKRTPLPDDQARLGWKCPCGEMRTASIKKSHARYIVKARKEAANEATNTCKKEESRNSNTNPYRPGTTKQSSSSQSGLRAIGSGSSSGPSPRSTTVGTQNASSLGHPTPSRYIPLMVSSGLLLLNEIESQDLCNEGLFNKIRDAYNGAKGVKRWFTTMKFSHCEFFKFEEWSRRRYCERGPGIPPKEDTEYYYVPRPMDREPPISRHEFHDRFYKKVPGEDCHFGVPRNICSDRDAVDRIPQINKLVSISDSKRQQFYGIVAREKKSGLMMMLYIMICSIPGTIFFFLWVFRWRHNSLQDASILLVLSWTLLGLLYAAQFL